MKKDLDILVIDNFLPDAYFYLLKEKVIDSGIFPWYYNENITGNHGDPLDRPTMYSYGFSHMVAMDGKVYSPEIHNCLFGFYGKILEATESTNIDRVRFEMTTNSVEKKIHFPHIDLDYRHIASVFYMTNSESETVIYDHKVPSYGAVNFSELYSQEEYYNFPIKQLVKPRENRILIFEGSYLHTSYSPNLEKSRVILNVNVT
jgi:hypothetical protein